MYRARPTMERRVYDGCCTPYETAPALRAPENVDQLISGLVDQDEQFLGTLVLIH
jgi:hypothetical protein